MKTLQLLAFLLVLLATSANAAVHARYSFQNSATQPQGVKTIRWQPLTEYSVNGTNIVTKDYIERTVSGTGTYTLSNLLHGTYRVTFRGANTETVFTNSFGTNVTGLVDASDPEYLAISTNLPAGLFAYSQAAANNRFIEDPEAKSVDQVLTYDGTNWVAAAATVGSSGSATNVFFGDGTNISHRVGSGGTNLFDLSLGYQPATNTPSGITNALGAVPVPEALRAATADTADTATTADALGGFAASAFSLTTNLYVATTGSDSAAGGISTPLATITNAIRRLNGNGTIYVRGGLYHNQDINLTNAENIRIVNYRDEYPEFWFGEGITPASFTLVSNGIYSATMPVAFSNALQMLETFWDAWSPLNRGIYLHQTNAPYGPNVAGSYFVPPLIDIKSETNRCEHAPLRQAASVTSMTHSNHYWFQEGPLLYVKFAVSNTPGGIYISSTNYTGGKAAVHSGSAKTRVYTEGIKTYFGGHGFDVSGCASWEFKSCLSYGAGYNAFHYNSESYPEPGGGKLSFCEGSGFNGFGFNGQGTIANTRMINIVEERCYWHDYLREASAVRENVSRIVIGSIAFAGRNGQFGFIDQGTSSLYIGCTSISNSIAGWQLGTATSLGRPSFQDIRDCRMIEDLVAIQLNDFNCIVSAYGNYFNPNAAGGYINVAENPESHFVRQGGNFGTVASSGIFINGTGVSSYPTRYINDPAYVGTSGSPLRVGNLQMAGADTISGYGIHMTGFRAKVDGTLVLTSGVITNGNMVLLGSTNTPPPTDPNHSYMAVSTNAHGVLFLWDGEWKEIREGAGGGDVTLDGDNILTGNNTLTGTSNYVENLYSGTLGVGLLVTDAIQLPFASALVVANASSNAAPVTTINGATLSGQTLTITPQNSTNIVVNTGVLAPSSNATNYTVPLMPGPGGNMLTIYLANTNAHLTFTGTNVADAHRTVLLRGWTNSVVSLVTFASAVRTNSNLNVWVTNGTAKPLSFYNADTTGTNNLVSDAGRYQ